MENFKINRWIITISLGLTLFSATSMAEKGYVIMDNTGGGKNKGVVANMLTALAPTTSVSTLDTCSQDDALDDKNCNSIDFRNDGDIQVVQNDINDNLKNMIGLKNPDSTDTNRRANGDPITPFPADKTDLFLIEKYRNAARLITTNYPSASGSTPNRGDMSFTEFLNNVNSATTMYGIVRVKIPMHKPEGEEDFALCGNTACSGICGPAKDDNIKPGETLCGVTLNNSSAINVKGSIMFDFIDAANRNPINLTAMPSEVEDIRFQLTVPFNVNASHNNTAGYLESIESIKQLIGNNSCSSGEFCNLDFARNIGDTFRRGLVLTDSENEYQYKMNKTLSDVEFSSLSDDQKFNLLLPSAYAEGWADAFSTLGISAQSWRDDFHFKIPNIDDTATTILTTDDIRSEQFEDIPAVIFTGGLASIQFHTNISGLIYAPQSLELKQFNVYNATLRRDVKAKQYINGAIIVRDSFYVDAMSEDGITLISNNPDVYSQIELVSDSPWHGAFVAFDESPQPVAVASLSDVDDNAATRSGGANDESEGGNYADIFGQPGTNPGPQWTQVKPN